MTLSSCKQETKNLIDIEIEEVDGKPTMTYYPKIKFDIVKDSAKILFNKKDQFRMIDGDIRVAAPIFQNDSIKVRVFLRDVYNINGKEYGFLVRTYTLKNIIIDEMVLASTIKGLSCTGKVTEDLKIISSCPDNNTVVAQIESSGTIKILSDD